MAVSRRGLSSLPKSEKPLKTTPQGESKLRRFLSAYLTRHIQAALLSLGHITRAPVTTVLICVVMGIALALPTGLYVLLKNVTTLTPYWEGSSPIVLYLKTTLTEHEVTTVAEQIRGNAAVAKVDYISPEQGLAELQQSDLGAALTALKQNPLPAVLVITAKPDWQTPQAETTLLNSFKALPEVDMAKLDLDWLKRLSSLLTLGEKLVDILAIVLSVGVVFVVGSTIHLAMESHHEEIEVYKLIGASDGFIRRPFLYRGVWYGLVGSGLAWLMMAIVMAMLATPVAAVSAPYGGHYTLQGLSFPDGCRLLLLGAILGWVGAWIVVYKRTRRFVE